MWHVDDPVLLADRLDRVREAHSARDLLPEEEADHLSLVVGLHLLARDHDEVPPARQLDRLEGTAKDVVVRDGDRSQALRLGVVDERPRIDRAVVRPVGMHEDVADEPDEVRDDQPVPEAGEALVVLEVHPQEQIGRAHV